MSDKDPVLNNKPNQVIAESQRMFLEEQANELSKLYGITGFDGPGIDTVSYGAEGISYESAVSLLDRFASYLELINQGDVGDRVFICLPVTRFAYEDYSPQLEPGKTFRVYTSDPNALIYLGNLDEINSKKFIRDFLDKGIYGFIANSINQILSLTPDDIDERGFVKVKKQDEG